MFEYIKGILVRSSLTQVTLDVQGMGYRLQIPFNHFAKLPVLGTETLLYVSCVIREDSHKLYGFLTEQERDLFEHLIDISGIGPKTALALIGHMELQQLQTAIQQGNVNTVCKIPGIGKKTAERLIVEMRDKIFKILGKEAHCSSPALKETGLIADAISALINLGYNNALAQKAVKAAAENASHQGKEAGLAALITSALRYI